LVILEPYSVCNYTSTVHTACSSHIHTYTCFNGNFYRCTWVSQLPRW